MATYPNKSKCGKLFEQLCRVQTFTYTLRHWLQKHLICCLKYTTPTIIPTFPAKTNMAIVTHLRSYLSQSSIHGLRHLLDRGENAFLVRTAWTLAITSTFMALSVIVYNTQRDYKDSPVATTSDFVPIQVSNQMFYTVQ